MFLKTVKTPRLHEDCKITPRMGYKNENIFNLERCLKGNSPIQQPPENLPLLLNMVVQSTCLSMLINMRAKLERRAGQEAKTIKGKTVTHSRTLKFLDFCNFNLILKILMKSSNSGDVTGISLPYVNTAEVKACITFASHQKSSYSQITSTRQVLTRQLGKNMIQVLNSCASHHSHCPKKRLISRQGSSSQYMEMATSKFKKMPFSYLRLTLATKSWGG